MKDSPPRIKIGRVLKTFGKDGQLRCQFQSEYIPLVKKGVFLWLEIDGLMVPFQVNKFIRQHKPLIYFEDINSEYLAGQLSGNWIYIKREDFPGNVWLESDSDTMEYSFLEGFEVLIYPRQLKGKIIRVEQYPGQEMAFVEIAEESRELMVPLVEEFISDINEMTRTVEFKLPDGFPGL